MKYLWGVLCTDVITDQETNSVSYIKCIEQVQSAKVPVVLPPFVIGTLWTQEGEENAFRFRIQVLTPEGQSRSVFDSGQILVTKQSIRVNVRAVGLAFESAGTHVFAVSQKLGRRWRKEAEIPVEITTEDEAQESV